MNSARHAARRFISTRDPHHLHLFSKIPLRQFRRLRQLLRQFGEVMSDCGCSASLEF
jgi:hypothetical protein